MELLEKLRARFPYLTDEQIQAILAMGQLQMLPKDTVLFEAGKPNRYMALVVQGLLRNYVTNEKGEQVTVVFAGEMQAIAPYAAVMLNQPATETTEAVEDSLVFVMDYHAWRQKTITEPGYVRLYVDVIEQILVAAIMRIEDFTGTRPEQRYQRLLDQQGYLIDRAPLKYLASYLGITPVSLSRIRKRVSKSRN